MEMCRHRGNSYAKPKTYEGRFNKRFGEKIHEIDGKRIVAATGRTGAGGARHLPHVHNAQHLTPTDCE